MKAKETLQNLSDICRKSSEHPENTKRRRCIDEKAIEDLNATIDEWGSDPWDLGNPALRSMQSGFPATTELIDDLNKAYEQGIEIMKTYYVEQITRSKKLISDTIKRNKRFSISKLLQEIVVPSLHKKNYKWRIKLWF